MHFFIQLTNTINKAPGSNTTQGTYDIWWERTKCIDTHLDLNKWVCGEIYPEEQPFSRYWKRKYQKISSCWYPTKWNAGNNKKDNALKQSTNDCMKTSATKNKYKLENRQTKIENPDSTENKIKIDKIK